MAKTKLTHFDKLGQVKMVDVSRKEKTYRYAQASGELRLSPNTIKLLEKGSLKKGDAFSVAKIAGILAAKKTSSLIPLCHPLSIDHIDIQFSLDKKRHVVQIISEVSAYEKTGVEMEALTALTHAALTLYDMCKSADKNMVINNIKLVKKIGGKSGTYERK